MNRFARREPKEHPHLVMDWKIGEGTPRERGWAGARWRFDASSGRIEWSSEALRLLELPECSASGRPCDLAEPFEKNAVVAAPLLAWITGADVSICASTGHSDAYMTVNLCSSGGAARPLGLRRDVEWGCDGLLTAVFGEVWAKDPDREIPVTEGGPVSNATLAAAAMLSGSAVIIVGAGGTIRWMSPAFTALTGFDEHSASGRTPSQLLSGAGADAAGMFPLDDAIHRREAVDFACVVQTRHGRRRWVDVTLRPIEVGAGETPESAHGPHTGISFVDVTDLRVEAQSLLLERRVAAVLLERKTLEDAAAGLTRVISETLEMPAVHLWAAESGKSTLTHLASHVYAPDPSKARTYADLMQAIEYRAGDAGGVVGVGLPGWAWGTARTQVVERLWPSSRRVEAALDIGVETMTAVPLMAPHGVIGILEVDGRALYPGHERLADRLANIATLISMFALKSVERVQFSVVFERSPDPLLLVDAQSVITGCNSRAMALFGEVVHTPLRAILGGIPPLSELWSASPASAVLCFEGLGRATSGAQFAAEASIGMAAGLGPTRYLVAIRDLTERRQMESALVAEQERVRLLESRQALLQRLVSELPVALLLVRCSGRVVMANDAAASLFREDKEGLVGRDVVTLLESDSTDDGWFAERGRRTDLRALRRDGHRVTVETRLRALGERDDDDVLVAIGEVEPQSGRFGGPSPGVGAASPGEAPKGSHLVDEVSSLRRWVDTAMGLLRSSSEKGSSLRGATIETVVQQLSDHASRLATLQSQLGTTSTDHEERVELELGALSVDVVCQASLAAIRPVAVAKGIRLAYDYDGSEPELIADAKRIRHVLGELMLAAERATDAGGTMTVTAQTLVKEPFVQITVTGGARVTGTAVGDGEVSQTGPAGQTRRASPDETPAWVGEARRVVAAHGGTLHVVLGSDSPTRFDVLLPLSQPPSRERPPEMPKSVISTTPAPPRTPARAGLALAELAHARDLKAWFQVAGVSVDSAVFDNRVGERVRAHRPAVLAVDLRQRSRGPAPDLRLGGDEVELRRDLIWLGARLRDVSPEAYPELLLVGNTAIAHKRRGGAIEVVAAGQGPTALAALVTNALLGHTEGAAPLPHERTALVLSDSEPTRSRALIVDDTRENVTHLVLYLEMHGFDVHVEDSAEGALAFMLEARPDVVLMDVHLPEMDGLEAIRRVRSLPRVSHTPIIAVTALAMPEDRQRCIDAGADDYVSKPVKLQLLLSKVRDLIGSRSMIPTTGRWAV